MTIQQDGYGFQINCCPIQYARSASDIKPLPPSTSTAPPLALEERVVSNRSSIGLYRNSRSNSSRAAASMHDGDEEEQANVIRSNLSRAASRTQDADDEEEQPNNIVMQRSLSTKPNCKKDEEEEGSEEGELFDCDTGESVHSQLSSTTDKPQSMHNNNTPTRDFASVR